MLINKNIVDSSLVKPAQAAASTQAKTGNPKRKILKLRLFCQQLNPKNWFNRLANIEITLEEFACKKTLPKE
jgi:hypothetical protein